MRDIPCGGSSRQRQTGIEPQRYSSKKRNQRQADEYFLNHGHTIPCRSFLSSGNVTTAGFTYREHVVPGAAILKIPTHHRLRAGHEQRILF
jgi:hypothetical protein